MTLQINCTSQYMFGTRIGDVSAMSHSQVYQRAVRGAAEMQQQFTVLPLAPCDADADVHSEAETGAAMWDGAAAGGSLLLLPSMRLLDHGHFVNYGGEENVD